MIPSTGHKATEVCGVRKSVAVDVVVEVHEHIQAMVEVIADFGGFGSKPLPCVFSGMILVTVESEIDPVRSLPARVVLDQIVDAQRGVVLPEDGVHGLAEPARVSEFDGPAVIGRRRLQELLQTCRVHAPSRRQLHQNGAEDIPKPIGPRQESPEWLARVCKLRKMRGVTAVFQRVQETQRGLLAPGIEGLRRRELVKGVVDLDRIEAFGVVSEPLSFQDLFRIENALPVIVLVSRRPDSEVSLFSSRSPSPVLRGHSDFPAEIEFNRSGKWNIGMSSGVKWPSVPINNTTFEMALTNMKKLISIIILLVPICFCSAGPPVDLPASGSSGMVSSAHPLATEAGLTILKSGGNAFDAAVAIAAALNVVEPDMSGMGGYGTILIYDARKGETRFLNPSGRIPVAVNSDVFRAPTPNYEENRRGAKAISTPGNVHAWEQLSKTYGKAAWGNLFKPAITLAEGGFPISDRLAKSIAAAYASFPDWARRDYGRDGRPLNTGERLAQKDLARSLRLVASKGAPGFYGGEIAKAVDAAMRERGGFLSMQDLVSDRAEWWKPIQINYRGYLVITASPPANTFDYLVRLGIMSTFDVPALGFNSVAYLHRFAEATKHGFWVRLRYAGDPEINPPPLERLLSEAYWKQEAAKIDPAHARPFVPPTEFSDGKQHTTHFVVADQWGNVVSATQTLGNAFGARIMAQGTGIWLNNSLAYCTFEPKGNPMDAHPGRRKLSGDCPTIILRDGRPWVAIGTPGGHTIGQTVPQMVMNLIDFKMDIRQAITAPRVSFFEPDTLGAEGGIPAAVRDQLSKMGHKIRVVEGLGNAHGLTIEYDSRHKPVRFTGAADPRGEGKAAGY